MLEQMMTHLTMQKVRPQIFLIQIIFTLIFLFKADTASKCPAPILTRGDIIQRDFRFFVPDPTRICSYLVKKGTQSKKILQPLQKR